MMTLEISSISQIYSIKELFLSPSFPGGASLCLEIWDGKRYLVISNLFYKGTFLSPPFPGGASLRLEIWDIKRY